MPGLDPSNPAQVAHEIARLTEMLEERTGEYRDDIEEAARLSAALKGDYARAMLVVIASSHGNRMTVAEKDARVEVKVNTDRIIAEVAEAKAKATKAALDSLRVQVDALRSLGQTSER